MWLHYPRYETEDFSLGRIMDRKVRLKILLMERGIKHVELAQMLGIDRSTLSLYINGWKPIPTKVRQQIAEILSFPANELFWSEDDEIH